MNPLPKPKSTEKDVLDKTNFEERNETILLEAKELSKADLFQNLSFFIRPGDRLAIQGPSGAGKTVLLKTLAQLIPCEKGHIWFRGQPIQKLFSPRYRSCVLYLPQKFRLEPGSVEANLESPFKFYQNKNKPFGREKAISFFLKLGQKSSFLEKNSEHLSGGEQQWVAMVRALLLNPFILLLDESMSALDEKNRKRVEELLLEWLCQDHGHALIFVSHDSEQRNRFATHRFNMGGLS